MFWERWGWDVRDRFWLVLCKVIWKNVHVVYGMDGRGNVRTESVSHVA